MKAGILIGHLNDKGNESALLRTAETFGINLVCILGKKDDRNYRESMSADKHMLFMEFKDADDFVTYAKGNNHSIICVENINQATEVGEIRKYSHNPIFVLGNEKYGIPKEILINANQIVKIKQNIGYMNCLNVSVAGGIIMHDFYKKELLKKEVLWEEASHRHPKEK